MSGPLAVLTILALGLLLTGLMLALDALASHVEWRLRKRARQIVLEPTPGRSRLGLDPEKRGPRRGSGRAS